MEVWKNLRYYVLGNGCEKEGWSIWTDKYQISNYGELRNNHKLLKEYTDKEGYKYYQVSVEKQRRKIRTHRALLFNFSFNLLPLSLTSVNHLDNLPSNNQLSNLEWCSPKQNTRHMLKQGRKACQEGASNNNSKLNDQLVTFMREMHETGHYSQKSIAEAFRVSPQRASKILRKEDWSHI